MLQIYGKSSLTCFGHAQQINYYLILYRFDLALSCSKTHTVKCQQQPQNWPIVFSCFLAALYVSVYLSVLIGHLKSRAGQPGCQLPVANRGSNEAVNATPRDTTAAAATREAAAAAAAAQRAQTLTRWISFPAK